METRQTSRMRESKEKNGYQISKSTTKYSPRPAPLPPSPLGSSGELPDLLLTDGSEMFLDEEDTESKFHMIEPMKSNIASDYCKCIHFYKYFYILVP